MGFKTVRGPWLTETSRTSTSTSCGPNLIPTLHALADLEPTTLAVMHGSSYRGDGGTQLAEYLAGQKFL